MQVPALTTTTQSSDRISDPVVSVALDVATLQPVIESSNPLLSFEENLLYKLAQIGMLHADGTLRHQVPKKKLNDQQIAKIISLLTDNEVDILNSDGKRLFCLSQNTFYIKHKTQLKFSSFHPVETYLFGEWANYIIDPIDCFCDMVKTFLHEKGYPENLLDDDLRELQMRKMPAPPLLIEWLHHLPNLDRDKVNQLEELHVLWLLRECYCSFSSNEEETKAKIKESCFLELNRGENFFEMLLGDQSGKVHPKLTKKRFGNFSCAFTVDSLRIPVTELVQKFNASEAIPEIFPEMSAQCIVDKILKLLRPVARHKLTSIACAKGAYYLSQNYHFPNSEPHCSLEYWQKKLPNRLPSALKTIARQYNSNPATLALASGCLLDNEDWAHLGPCIASPIITEAHRLLVNKGISWNAIQALLCFAGWVRIFHPFEGEEITITLHQNAKHLNIVYHIQDHTLQIPVMPKSYADTLLDLSKEQLEEVQSLWLLLIPERINSIYENLSVLKLFSSELLDACIKTCDVLVNHGSPFLNYIGYTCTLAAQQIFYRPWGIEAIFRKLPTLLPEDPELFNRELILLSSFLTPESSFKAKNLSKEKNLINFIHHLFRNKQRHYGKVLLDLVLKFPQDYENPLYEVILDQPLSYALSLYKEYANFLNVEQQAAFFFKTVSELPNAGLQALFQMARDILPSCNNTPDRQNFLLQFLDHATKLGFIEQTQTLLMETADYFDQSNWEIATAALCESLLGSSEHGAPGVAKAWAELSKKRNFPMPKVLADLQKAAAPRKEKKVERKEAPVSLQISEIALKSMTPRQVIKAVHEGLCQEIPALILKDLHTSAIITVIAEGQDLASFFAKHSFNGENCHPEKIVKALQEYFNRSLTVKREVAQFQALVNLTKLSILSNIREDLFTLLLEKIPALPCTERSGKEQACLHLLTEMLQTSSPQAVELLTLIWSRSIDSQIKKLLNSYKNALFSSLVNRGMHTKALSLLHFFEIHNIEKLKLLSVQHLRTLFQVKLAETQGNPDFDNVFSRLKFAVNACFTYSVDAIPILLQCLPILTQSTQRQTAEKMLHTCLSKLGRKKLEEYYPSLIQALGDKEATFHYLCSIANKSNEQIFTFAVERLFPKMDGIAFLNMLEKHVSILQQASPTILKSLEEILCQIADTKCELMPIFNFLDVIGYWPIDLLERIRVLRLSEQKDIFFILYPLELKGTFLLTDSDKRAYCYRLLDNILSDSSTEHLSLSRTADTWTKLLPKENHEEIVIRFLHLALKEISNHQESISELDSLIPLRLTVPQIPCLIDMLLIESLLKSKHLGLFESAIRLATKRISLQQSQEDHKNFQVTAKMLLDALPQKLHLDLVLAFCEALYLSYPGIFNEKIKTYLLHRMHSYLPKDEQQAFCDLTYHKQLIALFSAVLSAPTSLEFHICSHFIRHFSEELPKYLVQELQLKMVIAEMHTSLVSFKGELIVHSIEGLILFLRSFNQQKTDTFNPQSTFASAINQACANLTALIFPMKRIELFSSFIKKFLTAIELNTSEATATYCYLTLIEFLLGATVEKPIIQAIDNCLAKLHSIPLMYQPKFEELCIRFFRLPPSNCFNLYVRVYLCLCKTSVSLEPIKALYQCMVDFYGKNIIPKSCEALKVVVDTSTQKNNLELFLDISFVISRLKPLFASNLRPIIVSYQLFFQRLTSLKFNEALAFINGFIKELCEAPVNDKFYNLLFIAFFRDGIAGSLAHFKEEREELLQLASSFLATLIKSKKIDPQQLSLALRMLKPFNIDFLLQRINEEGEVLDYIVNLFENFEKKPSLLEDVLLKEIFSFMNSYLIEVLPHHKKMIFHTSDILRNATGSLVHLLSKGSFDPMPHLLIRLLKCMIPSNIAVIQTKLFADEEAQDYLTSLLFCEEIQSRDAFSTPKMLEKRIRLSIYYTTQLFGVNHDKAFSQGRTYISDIQLLLKTLLLTGKFNLGFPIYINLVKRLVPCNVALLRGQLQRGNELTNYIDDLLFGEGAKKSIFMKAVPLQEKLSLTNLFCQDLFAFDNERTFAIGYNMLQKSVQLLNERFSKCIFDDHFDIYLTCVKGFIPSNIAVIRSQVNKEQSLDNVIFPLLFNKEIRNPNLKETVELQKKISVAILFITALLEIDSPASIVLEKELREQILKMMLSLYSQGDVVSYLEAVQDFAQYNVSLLKMQASKGQALSDLLSPTISENTLLPFISKKMSILGQFAKELIDLKTSEAVELGSNILNENASMLGMLLAKNLISEPIEYLKCVAAFVPANLALQKVRPGNDVIFELLFCNATHEHPFMNPTPYTAKLTHGIAYIKGLIQVGNDESISLSNAIWLQLSLMLSHLTLTEENTATYLGVVDSLMTLWVALLKFQHQCDNPGTHPIFSLLFNPIDSVPPSQKAAFIRTICRMCLPQAKKLMESDHIVSRKEGKALLKISFDNLQNSFSKEVFQEDYSFFIDCVVAFMPANVALANLQKNSEEDIVNYVFLLLFGKGTNQKGFTTPTMFKKRFELHNIFASDLIRLNSEESILHGKKILDDSYFMLDKLLREKHFDINFPLYLDCVEALITGHLSLFNYLKKPSENFLPLLFGETSTQSKFRSFDTRRIAIARLYANTIASLNTEEAQRYCGQIEAKIFEYAPPAPIKKRPPKKKGK